MNTFVIKSYCKNIIGQYIGLSNDGQVVYIYRSHKVFKNLNPDLDIKDFTVIEDMDKSEFDFRKYNVCPACGGLKYWYRVSCDKPMNGKVLYDEDGFCLFDKEINVHCICDDGSYIGHLEHDLRMSQRETEDARKNYQELRDYIRKTSTCKTCHGDQGMTLGLCNCKECGLPGNCVWPG